MTQKTVDPTIKQITGFKEGKNIETDGGGNFLLAYCYRNGKVMSPWFTEQGSFDKCLGSYNSVHQTIEYNEENIGFVANLFTI
jgi:hypothetical protein